MKKYLLSMTISLLTLQVGHSQTVVSGGIYSNTTWTLANSPYIADTVVVFPNVTLTIQPGVVVKVIGGIEIRQATIIAEGTYTDSITFIGDSLSNITLWLYNAQTSKINYCNFKDGPTYAMWVRLNSSSDSLTILNSTFTNNGTGIFQNTGITRLDSCIFKNNSTAIDQVSMKISHSIFRKNQNALVIVGNSIIQNCTIDSNTVIGIEPWDHNTITNCQIRNNGIGIKCTSGGSYNSQIYYNIIENNIIGIELSNEFGPDSIYCNKICNNTSYNINATTPHNRIVTNNYWCTNDSIAVASSIYDGYDNVSLGLVYFMPMDTSQCYLTTEINNPIAPPNKSYKIFPNPFSSQTTLESDNIFKNATLIIYNAYGQQAKQIKNIFGQTFTLQRGNLSSGLYFLQLKQDNKILTTYKIIITDR